MNARLAAIALVVLLANTAADAEPLWDGNKLNGARAGWLAMQQGRSANNLDILNNGFYGGFIVGINDLLQGSFVCTPANATLGQEAAIVSKYTDATFSAKLN